MTVEVLNMTPFLTVDSTLFLLLVLISSTDALIKAPTIATIGMKPLFQVNNYTPQSNKRRCMRTCVFLNLLNQLRETTKFEAVRCVLSLFPNELDTFKIQACADQEV